MNIDRLYKLQARLDKHILDKHKIKMSKEELLDNTILALLVEIGELANTTRCFKHWSTKGMMGKEVILDELADVWHFYLSIGNQLDRVLDKSAMDDIEIGDYEYMSILQVFNRMYQWTLRISDENEFGDEVQYTSYEQIGLWVKILWDNLGFTDKEVEQAYLKKHEENYKRQREGY